MREVSDNFYDSAYAQETDKVYLHLLDVYLEKDDGTVFEGHYVPNYLPVESNGVLYQPAAFKITLGADINDSLPQVTLEFDSGDRQLIRLMRDNRNRPTVRLSVVISNSPDVVEIGPIEFEIKAFTIKSTSVNAELTIEPILNEPIPSANYTPMLSPGLFKNTVV